MLQTDLADVLGKKPVVLTFATPLLCQPRLRPGGRHRRAGQGERAQGRRLHPQEIYKDNQVNKGVRPQVAAWGLASEPWTFVIDRKGRISARFEGAFSVGELQRAVAKVA